MRLPDTLLQEIQKGDGSHQPHLHRSRKPHPSRKDARKQERLDRKKRKGDFHTSSKRSADGDIQLTGRKKAKYNDSIDGQEPMVRAAPDPRNHRQLKKTTEKKDYNKNVQATVIPKCGSQAEEEEDAYIAYLEARLGYGDGNRKKSKSSDDDGLDDLLNFADSLFAGAASSPSRVGAGGVETVTGDEAWSEHGDDDDGDVGQEEVDQESILLGEDETEDELGYDEEEWDGIDGSMDWKQGTDDFNPEQTAAPTVGPTSGATSPAPSSQKNTGQHDVQGSEALTRLTKQLKGLLNRMSEQNLTSILDGIEDLYRQHRRHDVTSTLTNLIINGITSHSSLLDSYVVLHAALVSGLHRLIGVEFAAFFIQRLVSDYEHHYTAAMESILGSNNGGTDSVGKECANLIVLLSELYNFQVIASVLVYDIIRSLLKGELSEFGVELLLKLLRSSGQQLRQDDPSALKDIVGIVQHKVSGQEANISSRARFMLEMLTNLKNNKMKRNLTQNQGGEAVERMKKLLSVLGKKRHFLAQDALRVSLHDLHAAETKGKWWLVGAGWAGDPLLDKRGSATNAPAEDHASDKLQKLARKHGMNTDIRRSVFVVIMSSDDYVDACERLSQLNLKEVQEREIIRVLLHCCGNEQTYNPYYTLVCQHLCRTSHSYRITLQYCLWDFLRDLGESGIGGIEVVKNMKGDGDGDHLSTKTVSKIYLSNIAKAYGWWIAKGSVTLTILKPVDFTTLKARGKEFLRELVAAILISSQVTSPVLGSSAKNLSAVRDRAAVEEIFIKATRVETLAMGLVYFMTETFRDGSHEVTKLIRWSCEVAKDTLRTGLDITPIL
ncbi:hypothetical protein AX17_002304 [Amanita inopinata Kibby_2008]|nr:hypothetical protein AX17_002304 [Amanita inopinata Kibby_2008]